MISDPISTWTWPAKLEPVDLIDPWEREYVYEPSTLSETGRPKIHVQDRPISNW